MVTNKVLLMGTIGFLHRGTKSIGFLVMANIGFLLIGTIGFLLMRSKWVLLMGTKKVEHFNKLKIWKKLKI